MPSCYPRLVHHPILRRGTVGTMVPICVGDRENRGPSDHVRTIFYMSRATPEKRKVWSARPGSWPAGLRPSPSLAHRDHGPDGPDGPDGHRRPLSTAPPGVSSLGGRVSAFHRHRRDHLAATVPTRRRDPRGPRRTPNRRSTRSVRPGDLRLRELRFGRAPTSTDCGRRCPIFPPVVCRVASLAWPISWLSSWFQASAMGVSRRPLVGHAERPWRAR
jgi:hypothetical protein